MSSPQFAFNIPSVNNYEIKYYFSDKPTTYNAKVFPHHIHVRLEIYILLEGNVSFAVESSVYKVNPGDAIITKPNETHNCILETDSTHKHICFWFDCENDFLFSDFLSHDFGKNNLVCPDENSRKRLIEIYSDIESASINGDKHKLYYLSLEMLDIFRKSIKAQTDSPQIPKILKNILQDIENNLKEIKSLSYFTNKYFISNSTLNRLFKDYLHTTPKLYLETKRLAYSRRLLAQGSSVLYACMESGFPDYSNYIRLFKRRFSITPKQYRDNQK